ncbi:hypothetical protein QFC21_004142 [Naganishia friedmannii]|uniref:Uncharacterized protein n=1 Tax=Naganishia friedmannii TaxID=89922 RepID=A0ACC2VJH4_9TREE|nr:hypothetical protein QFC21_004142 [Naganishia friedmannii]
MDSNDIAEKGTLPSDMNEKGPNLPLDTSESPVKTYTSWIPRIKTNRQQKVILALACVYYPFLAWSVYKGRTRVDLVNPAGTASVSDAYLEGLSGQGWSFTTMQDRIDQPTGEQGVFFSQSLDHEHHKGDKHKHGDHKHHRPPFRHITPSQAEEIFFKVPNNDSAAAEHMAGTGNDHLSALNLKAEWEAYLGLPYSAPYENVFEAGSAENQAAVRGLENATQSQVWVDTYYPIMNKPVSRSLDILLPEGNGLIEWSATLREDIVEGDPTSVLRDEVAVFHGLSVSGNVTAPILFVGYGTKRDFEDLERAGIDAKGTIVLVKYGKVFRGLKVKAAQEAGALGCLIYSDPGDDGEITIDNGYEVYPNGPARNPSSVQRGSVQFLSSYPGDPSTPGYPAYKNATRVEGGNQPSIPSLPISYADALPLLKTLEGKGKLAREVGQSGDWPGGLKDVEYFTGPSEKQVRFINEVDTKVTPIWNVFATIPGHIRDEVVVIGNHRDAWVLGGADPSSGTASVNEIMRGFSALLEKGWKPLRTIVVSSFDAEEMGLIGSTEWCEDFGDWLGKNVVAYLNVDVSVSGSNLGMSASPSLAHLMRHAAMQVEHPTDKNRSLWSMQDGGDWNTFNQEIKGLSADIDYEEMFASELKVKALGSGSDYTAFLQRYGVASTDMGYGFGPNDPVYHYHSIYDSYTWQEKYGDPGFHRHVAAAKVLGLMALRVANDIVLPLNISQYSLELSTYLEKVSSIAAGMGVTDQLDFAKLHENIIELQNASSALDNQAADALKRLSKLIPEVPHRRHGRHCKGVKGLWRKAVRLVKSALGIQGRPSHYEQKFQDPKGNALQTRARHHGKHPESGHKNKHGKGKHPHHGHKRPHMPMPDPKKVKAIKQVLLEIRAINQKLAHYESGFLSKEGLKDREWYLHKGTAPGKWLGYGATTFPALTEALTIEKSTSLAQKEANELAEMIGKMAERLHAA